MQKIITFFLLLSCISIVNAQNADVLVKKVKAKLEQVNDYIAEGKMKTDVAFIKAPLGKVIVYYKKPNKIKLIKGKGISILPKGGITMNTSSIIGMSNYRAIDAGDTTINGNKTRIVVLIPLDINSEVSITYLYIDEANLLIRKSATTTKENGSFEMEMFYGAYTNFGLPDKMIFSFNLKDYRMPKGVTLDFDDDLSKEEKLKLKKKKGKVEFTYTKYTINKGVDDSMFK